MLAVSRACYLCGASPGAAQLGYRTQQQTPMPERSNANLFEVLIGQIRQDDKANVVLGKPQRVLPEAELLKPVSDLLHCGQRPENRASSVYSMKPDCSSEPEPSRADRRPRLRQRTG
jgi:hypothetical protein